jgi:hypothetical protein
MTHLIKLGLVSIQADGKSELDILRWVCSKRPTHVGIHYTDYKHVETFKLDLGIGVRVANLRD